ncbi:hypothetical protein [Pseudarthrobacter sp. L1SW]|uniref:hypothetical protein n=1 Tax=Pseudarthrobacter sp. L1SW TaxID=2851598 RepID=UPI001E38D879|nr:hypothetical protein [Pseudarthrobacter sp. L1SW]UEL27038.1 hypothetical protein KTR40_10220 [Pseudarthrobacter sp. L1SW]
MADGPVATRRNTFLAQWVGWVSLGESLGFLAPALAQSASAALGPAAAVPLLVLAGFVEGAVLGWFQVRVLRTRLPGVSARRWVLLTAAAAVVAWAVALLTFSNEGWQGWPAPAQAATGAVAAVVVLVSIGLAQWVELRHHAPQAWRWVAGSAAAWAAGLGVFMAAATPLWQPGQELWLVAAIGIGAAILMAVAMAVVTGLVMVRLLPTTWGTAGQRRPEG